MAQRAMRVGIRQVAERAGVSATTVSHAFSGKGRLPEATVERVLRIAAELGYRPNSSASNLARRRAGVLAIIIPNLDSEFVASSDYGFYLRSIMGGTSAAIEYGYALATVSAGQAAGAHFDALSFDGAVVADPVADDVRLTVLAQRNTPIITIGRCVGGDPLPFVDNDHAKAVTQALDYLCSRGAERPALLGRSTGTSYDLDCENAYREWCRRRPCQPIVATELGGAGPHSRDELCRRLLDSASPPDAVHATTDELARAFALADAELGTHLVANDRLTTLSVGPAVDSLLQVPRIDVLPERLGDAAVRLLADIIESGEPAASVVLPTEFLIPQGSRTIS